MRANRTSLILASLLILSIVALVGCASGGAARLSTVGNPVPPGDAEAYGGAAASAAPSAANAPGGEQPSTTPRSCAPGPWSSRSRT
jgi:hypothetical protein